MTASVIVPVGLISVIRLPACSPNRAAVCAVTATATVPAGSARPSSCPATREALLASESR